VKWFWPSLLAALLLVLVALPLALPLLRLLAEPDAWRAWGEHDRLLGLASNTCWLVGGTLLLAMPLGVGAAVLLYRTDLPGRHFLRFVVLLTLLVPLPLFTSGWQAVLGPGGLLPFSLWNVSGQWAPWGQGVGEAVWIQAIASLPWVVLLVGQGLRWVERDLEEDGLTIMPPWRVLLRVTLPRSAAAIGAAGLWIALQAASEITVSDVMQVRTFAEEVYTQFVSPDLTPGRGDGLSRAVAVALPLVLLTAVLVLVMVRHWHARLPSRATLLTPPLVFRLGRWRWPLALLVATACGLLVLPLASLVWRAGLTGMPPHWSAETLGYHLARAGGRRDGPRLLVSLAVAAGAGVLAAGMGLLSCWVARRTAWFRAGVMALAAVAWAMPGPLVGLGLLRLIQAIVAVHPTGVLAHALYYGESAAPLLWVDFIRFFPCALALLWPVVRLVPGELCDAARVDGMTPLGELRHVYWPLTASACDRAALAVAILSLGEVSAGKLVHTPNRDSYAIFLFTQMHYGLSNDLAAGCLLLLAVVAFGAALMPLVGRKAPRFFA
jgi:iron(III) transport system permease protein